MKFLLIVACMSMYSLNIFSNSEVNISESSEAYGIKKNQKAGRLQVMGQIGARSNGITGLGATLGYYINEDTVIELGLISGESSGDEYSYSDNNEVDTINLGVRKYFGDSLNLKTSLVYIDYKNTYTDQIYSYSMGTTISERDLQVSERKDLAVSFSVGNQWHWDNFSIGCDWIGVEYGLVNLSKSIDDSEYYYITEEIRDKNWTSFTLLNVNVGMTF